MSDPVTTCHSCLRSPCDPRCVVVRERESAERWEREGDRCANCGHVRVAHDPESGCDDGAHGSCGCWPFVEPKETDADTSAATADTSGGGDAVDAAARVAWETSQPLIGWVGSWETMTDGERDTWRIIARAVLAHTAKSQRAAHSRIILCAGCEGISRAKVDSLLTRAREAEERAERAEDELQRGLDAISRERNDAIDWAQRAVCARQIAEQAMTEGLASCERLRAELDAAWKAAKVPVRGMVSLAEVVDSLRTARDTVADIATKGLAECEAEHRAEVARLKRRVNRLLRKVRDARGDTELAATYERKRLQKDALTAAACHAAIGDERGLAAHAALISFASSISAGESGGAE